MCRLWIVSLLAVACGGCQSSAFNSAAPDSLNEGFVGGPCTGAVDCDFDDAICLDGPTGGMCSLSCQRFCPDREGAITTFCVAPNELDATADADAGLCATHCDYGESPTGCRAGYQCVATPRFNEPETVAYSCLPGEDRAFELTDCHRELLAARIAFMPAVSPGEHPSGHPELDCVVEDPVWLLRPVINDVSFLRLDDKLQPIFASCALASALDRMTRVLREARFSIDQLNHSGTYNCRLIVGGTSTAVSEHGRGNAIDIHALGRDDDGATFSVVDHWEHDQPDPVTTEGIFLRDLAERLYRDQIFNVILTPDYNADHDDHFHLDLTPGEHLLR